jgi:hypothetical protein
VSSFLRPPGPGPNNLDYSRQSNFQYLAGMASGCFLAGGNRLRIHQHVLRRKDGIDFISAFAFPFWLERYSIPDLASGPAQAWACDWLHDLEPVAVSLVAPDPAGPRQSALVDRLGPHRFFHGNANCRAGRVAPDTASVAHWHTPRCAAGQRGRLGRASSAIRLAARMASSEIRVFRQRRLEFIILSGGDRSEESL